MCMLYLALAFTFWGDIFNHFILVGPKRVHSPSFRQILVCLPSCVPQLAKIATWQKSTFPLFFLSLHYTLFFFFTFSADSGFSLRFLQEMGCGQLKKCSQGHKINYRNRIHNDRASVGAAAPSTFAMKTDNCMYLLFSVSSTSSGLGHLPLESL